MHAAWATVVAQLGTQLDCQGLSPFLEKVPRILDPYLHIVVLLSQVFISQKLIDGAGLSPWRKEEKAGRLIGQGAGSIVQGWPDSSPKRGQLGVFLGQ